MSVELHCGDCLSVLRSMADATVDAVVTDPPYELAFMGHAWDRSGVAFRPETWGAVARVMKPGAYLLAFGGSRTHHRMACAIEDAGLVIRDCVMWLYGQGFPKSKSCLKPAYEPIVVAWKPAKKVTPLNVDGCRVPAPDGLAKGGRQTHATLNTYARDEWTQNWVKPRTQEHPSGRWPANVVHDGSPEVMEAFAAFGEKPGGISVCRNGGGCRIGSERTYSEYRREGTFRPDAGYSDTGTADRFFFCAKVSPSERGDNSHPTVKPLALMEWLCRLVTPAGGTILDPFMGSGTTGVAAVRLGFNFIGVELDSGHVETANRRIDATLAETPLFATLGLPRIR